MTEKCPGCGEMVEGYDIDHLTGEIWHTCTEQLYDPTNRSVHVRPVQVKKCPGKLKEMAKMYVVIDLDKWDDRKEPENLIEPPAKILGKEEAIIVLSPYGFPEHRAIRFLIEIELIVPEDWEDRDRGIFYGGIPGNPRTNFTRDWRS